MSRIEYIDPYGQKTFIDVYVHSFKNDALALCINKERRSEHHYLPLDVAEDLLTQLQQTIQQITKRSNENE